MMTPNSENQAADNKTARDTRSGSLFRSRRGTDLTIFALVLACTLAVAGYIRANADRELAQAQLEAGRPLRASVEWTQRDANPLATVEKAITEDNPEETVTP